MAIRCCRKGVTETGHVDYEEIDKGKVVHEFHELRTPDNVITSPMGPPMISEKTPSRVR